MNHKTLNLIYEIIMKIYDKHEEVMLFHFLSISSVLHVIADDVLSCEVIFFSCVSLHSAFVSSLKELSFHLPVSSITNTLIMSNLVYVFFFLSRCHFCCRLASNLFIDSVFSYLLYDNRLRKCLSIGRFQITYSAKNCTQNLYDY